MSSEKTEYFQLHSWTAEDAFLRQELNENFAMLELALQSSQVVVGSYRGNGILEMNTAKSQDIILGRRPKAVFAFADQTWGSDTYRPLLGLLVDRQGSNAIGEILENGFRVWYRVDNYSPKYPTMNANETYHYIAFC